MTDGRDLIYLHIEAERLKQDKKWGEQNHPDGTGGPGWQFEANVAREVCRQVFAAGQGTWRNVLDEEVAEAFAESDPQKLRAELIQVAAVAIAWVEAIERRAA